MAVEIRAHGYDAEIGRITETRLGFEDHGIFTASIFVDLGSRAGQFVGGYCLSYKPPGARSHVFTPLLGEHLYGFMRAARVSCWEDLKGRELLVLRNDVGIVMGVAPLNGGEPFVLADWSARAEEYEDVQERIARDLGAKP